jgi:ribosomal protein L11 methyltransferase
VEKAELFMSRNSLCISSFAQMPEENFWIVQALYPLLPDALFLLELENFLNTPVHLECIKQKNWLEENLTQFPPIHAGRYHIIRAHHPAPLTGIVCRMDVGMAFGSGEHPTTFTCLLALDRLARYFKPSKMLDLGCGSGILALFMHKTWPNIPFFGSDIDPVAVKVSHLHAKKNACPSPYPWVWSKDLDHPKLKQNKPYDLVVANILANPLCALAYRIAQVMPRKKPRILILSGFLVQHQFKVLSAYQKVGFVLKSRFERQGWCSLVLT